MQQLVHWPPREVTTIGTLAMTGGRATICTLALTGGHMTIGTLALCDNGTAVD